MANDNNEAATEATEATPFDSNKAITACHGITASIVAAQEALGEAIEGRFQYKQRQRILAAGLSAANTALRSTVEFPRGMVSASGVASQPAAPEGDVVLRDELEALMEHRIALGVDRALGELRGQSGELRDLVDQAVNAKSGQLEAKLVSIVQETLTESLRTLEESLEDRMREIAAAATTAAAERERVNKALDEARKAAEQGIKAAGGDQILEQIEDVRDIRIDVGDFNVGDIEERSATDTSTDNEAVEGDEVEAAEGEVEAAEEEVEAAEGEVEAAEEEVVEAAEEEVVEAAEEEVIEAAEEEVIEAAEEEVVEAAEEEVIEAAEEEVVEAAEEEVIEAAEEEVIEAAEEEIVVADDGEDIGIDVDGLDSVEMEEIEVDLSAGAELDAVQTGEGEPLFIAEDEAEQSAEIVDAGGDEPIEVEAGEADEPIDEEIPAGEEADEEAINRYLELASKLRGRKNFPAAMELYIKVLELDAQNFEAHVGLGAVHLQTPDYDAAQEEFATALEIDPDSPAGYLGMGEVHFLKKEYAKAIKQYGKCLDLDADLAQAYCNRGLSYYYQKNHKKAFLDLQKAYRLDPEIPNIKKYLQMVMKVIKKQEDKKS